MASTSPPLTSTRSSGVQLGFAGVGWIGRQRMESILNGAAATAIAIADPDPEACRSAGELAPTAGTHPYLDPLLDLDLDGVVIATPSALHCEQAITALERGLAVFCQKPLGRDAAETARAVEAARRADRLLEVDFSYRHTEAVEAIVQRIREGELGHVHAIQMVFHNAYGPDKPWFYRRSESGGGCLIDLGVHLVDLALWSLDFPAVESVAASLTHRGRPVSRRQEEPEDYAAAQLELASGTSVQLACSWRAHAGYDAVIEVRFFGTRGGATLSNVNGSFYDLVAHLHRGTERQLLAEPPDAWPGRAAVRWARRLAEDRCFDRRAQHYVQVAEVLDAIQAAGSRP